MGYDGWVEGNIYNQHPPPQSVGWKNSNLLSTHQSINLVGQLKILTVSTWAVEPVAKIN